jgi:hypothetical protein
MSMEPAEAGWEPNLPSQSHVHDNVKDMAHCVIYGWEAWHDETLLHDDGAMAWLGYHFLDILIR